MNKRDFDRRLATEPLPKSIMLHGDNLFHIDRAVETIIEKSGAKENMLRLYFDEYNFAAAKSYLSQTSLFGDLNLLLIRCDKRIPKKELAAFVELTRKEAGNYFLLAFTGEARTAREMAGAFAAKSNAIDVRFFPANNLSEGVAALQTYAAAQHLAIERQALEHLLLKLNLDLALAAKELEKLALLGHPPSVKEIDELVYSLAPVDMDRFSFALFGKQKLSTLIAYWQQLGEDEIALLRAIQYFLRDLFLFHTYIKLRGSVDAKAILGYMPPKRVLEARTALAIKIDMPTFETLFSLLMEYEERLKKSSAVQKETLFLALLIKLQNFL